MQKTKWVIWERHVFSKAGENVRGEGGVRALKLFLLSWKNRWDNTFSSDGKYEVRGNLVDATATFTLTFYRREVAKPIGFKEL